MADLSFIENVLAVTRDLPDVYTEVCPQYDFRGDAVLIERAEAVIEAQSMFSAPAAMQEAKILSSVPVKTGTKNQAFIHIVELSTGSRAYCKLAEVHGKKKSPGKSTRRHEEVLNECAAYFVAALLGKHYSRLMPPLILKKYKGRICQLVDEVDGQIAADVPGWDKRVSAGQIVDAGLVDMILASGDRHEGNFMISNTDDLVLIDHESCFGRSPSLEFVHRRRSLGASGLSDGEVATLQLFSSAPVMRAVAALVGDEPGGELEERCLRMLRDGKV